MFLQLISALSILPACLMVLLCWKKIGPAHRTIGGLVAFTLIMDAMAWYCFFYSINNYFLFMIFTWIEGILLTVYYLIQTKRTGYWYLFAGWGIIFLVMSGTSMYIGESPYQYNSMQRSGGSIWSILICIFFFFYIFQRLNINNLLTYSHYWMTSGFLIYFAGMLFFNLTASYVTTHSVLSFNPFIIHSILNIFLNIIYTIVLWLGRREAILDKY